MLSWKTFQEQKERISKRQKKNELNTHSKNINIRDLHGAINEFKDSYQPRTNLVKDEHGVLLPDYHILSRWKNYFSQLYKVIHKSLQNF
jgi:hypothetical protein